MCCAKQSPYQHLAHHTALCQLGPQCQDCQRMTGAQTHFLSRLLAHGFIIMPLSLLHQTTKTHNLCIYTLPLHRESDGSQCHFMSRLGEHCVFLLLCSNFTPLNNQNLSSFEEVVGGGKDGGGGLEEELLHNTKLILLFSPSFDPFSMCLHSPHLSYPVVLHPLSAPTLKYIAVRPGCITSGCSTSLWLQLVHRQH